MIRFPSVQSNANAAYRRAIDASRDVQSPSVILSTSLCRSAGPANVLSLGRHVPSHSGSATRSVAQNEARKRRANERHVVGCCEELGGRTWAYTSGVTEWDDFGFDKQKDDREPDAYERSAKELLEQFFEQ